MSTGSPLDEGDKPVLEHQAEDGQAKSNHVEPCRTGTQDGADSHAHRPPEKKPSCHTGLREEGLAHLASADFVHNVDDESGRVDDHAQGKGGAEKDKCFPRPAIRHEREDWCRGLVGEKRAGQKTHHHGTDAARDSNRRECLPFRELRDEAEPHREGAGEDQETLSEVAEHDREEKDEEDAHEGRRVDAAVPWRAEGQHHPLEAGHEGTALEENRHLFIT